MDYEVNEDDEFEEGLAMGRASLSIRTGERDRARREVAALRAELLERAEALDAALESLTANRRIIMRPDGRSEGWTTLDLEES